MNYLFRKIHRDKNEAMKYTMTI